jgi:hypothetical protein
MSRTSPIDAPSLAIPAGHTGPFWLPVSGRLVWWTGRVAIGLRYQSAPRVEPDQTSACWLQDLMLRGRGANAAA